jgi:hypothetical protein
MIATVLDRSICDEQGPLEAPGKPLPGASSFPGGFPFLLRTGIAGRHFLSFPVMTLGRLRAS